MYRFALLFLLSSVLLHVISAQEEGPEPSIAILFPWFAEVIGVIVFFILTRSKYISIIPYTAVMFLIGTACGTGAARLSNDDRLTVSILQWANIDSEVILLVFLPGLIFKDAFALNVHLFVCAFWQIITLAFPMVLAGTCLTALVGFYIFPYDWSWTLSMTFGSILAATDPVAVAALLDDVGAPPRLKMHIGGESMMNDGSSYVFYTIFSLMYLLELDIPGVGENVDLGKGVQIFCQMAFGGMAFGLAFGLALVLLLSVLNRKLKEEENIVQVAATITIAYLAYYIADISETSGVISVVFTGLTAKAFGAPMINDPKTMDAFWGLVEQLLNTLLFTLAGVVWGTIIAGLRNVFEAKDWGYMFLLWVLLNVIRFILVFSFFPIVSRIGLKSNWQEAFFSSYAGLRGAVGISLSLSLLNQVLEETENAGVTDDTYIIQAEQLFAMVSGVVFFGLFINGPTAGPLLKKLGLARSTATREKLVEDIEQTMRLRILDDFVRLLADARFQNVDFALVKNHLPLFQDLTLAELKAAVLRNKDVTPNLQLILPHLETGGEDLSWATTEKVSDTETTGTDEGVEKAATILDVIELRHFFLGILSTVYNAMLESGEMDGREGFLSYMLIQSLDVAGSDVDRGSPLNDWDAANLVGIRFSKENVGIRMKMLKCKQGSGDKGGDDRGSTFEYQKLRIDFLRAMIFVEGHKRALEKFSNQFEGAVGGFVDTIKLVTEESQEEMRRAKEVLQGADQQDAKFITAHYFCQILLNKMATFVQSLHEGNVLQDREAAGYLEKIEQWLDYAKHSQGCVIGGEVQPELASAVKLDDQNEAVGDDRQAGKDGTV